MKFWICTLPLLAILWGHSTITQAGVLGQGWWSPPWQQSAYIPDTPKVNIAPTARSDWRQLAPGVLVDRWAAPAASDVIPAATSYFVRYTTVNVRGERALASGIVLVPHGAYQRARDWPLVVYGHMTTGVADACAPSRGVSGSSELRRMQQGDSLATALLTQGAVVARPDYEGLGEDGPHPYLRGDSLARSMRDMAQAVARHWPQIGGRWVAAGHSEGGVAALNAGSRKHPPLEGLALAGVVSMAPVTQMERVVAFFQPVGLAGAGVDTAVALAALAVKGVAAVDPDFERLALEEGGLSERALALWPDLERLCLADLTKKGSWGGLSPRQAQGPKGPQMLAELERALEQDDVRLLPMSREVPVRLDAALGDVVILYPRLDQLARDYRRRGVDVTYTRWPTGHSDIVDKAAPTVAQWIMERF